MTKPSFYENANETVMDYSVFRAMSAKNLHKTLERRAKERKERKKK